MESQPLRTVLLLGRPGSGKGTQTGLLAEHLGWKTVSSGNIFRELRNDQSPLGEKVRETYDTGVLFPGWFPTYFFLDAVLKLEAEQGVICEGFARSVDQAEVFDDALGWLGRKYVVFNLEVSEEEALRRQLSRHEIDARPSDAVALSLRVKAPIFVTPEVLESNPYLVNSSAIISGLDQIHEKVLAENRTLPEEVEMEWRSFRSLPRGGGRWLKEAEK